MKPSIFFVLSLLLILEKQAAVIGQHDQCQESVLIQTKQPAYDEDENQTQSLDQDQGHGQNEDGIPDQYSSTQEGPLIQEKQSTQGDASQGKHHVLTINQGGGDGYSLTQNPNQDQWLGQYAREQVSPHLSEVCEVSEMQTPTWSQIFDQ
ncbi:PREDICTED: semenogelin-2-like [Galeopterus variegatus]|uniref:Semenogelin-2-like n=1 Tax=Galeopterus variegatus TaxID=482537 RepID=A0ABM0S4J0_GALVR|nr:PREDICTED: semenogelin-2-like [Galeopterus variegatus]